MGRWDWVGRVHLAIYRRSNGRIGHRLAGKTMLLLTSRGRRSGVLRTTPLLYYPDADDCPVIVASNGGQGHDPAWCHNLRADPRAIIQIGREHFEARAEFADPAERGRLWPLLEAYNPPYRTYARRTERDIPVILLRRLA